MNRLTRRFGPLALVAMLLAAGLGPAASPAQADPEFPAVGPFRLPGALEVVTLEDHAHKRVTIDTWVGAGSAADFPGHPGLAAATALALWEGVKPAAAGRIQALGGQSEVEVGRDYAHISVTVPSDKLAEALTVVGEAFAHPRWEALDLDRVRHLMALRRDGASADEVAMERAFAALFPADYGHPVYAGEEAVRQLTGEELQAFYDRYYVPQRVKVVLVGDLDTGKSVGQVVNSFAGFLKREAATGPVPMRPLAAESLQWRRADSRLVFGARGPSLADQREQAAMALLAEVLAGDGQGRLEQALGERAKLAAVSWQPFAGPGALVVQVSADPAERMAIEKTVRDALGELRSGTVSLNEHARAMRRVLEGYDRANRSGAEQAETLGYYALVGGDHRLAKTYPDVVRQVSRQDLMAVAQRYLTPDQLKVVVLTQP